MRKIIALKLVGGCSDTSKMPGRSYGLPTANCITGEKLAKLDGSICSNCYAKKGFYRTYAHSVIPAQQRRLDAMQDPQWVEAMVVVLKRENWFRWFDSGDLQSAAMLTDIAEVARLTPWCRHWLSTRERGFVRAFLKHSEVPKNLCIRVSATFPDVPVIPVEGVNQGNVHSKGAQPLGQLCPAPTQNGKCETCRACWDKNVVAVSYIEH